MNCSVQEVFECVELRTQVGESKVKVTGAKGLAPTPTYKICSTSLDGFRGTCAAVIAGGRAAPKGRKVGCLLTGKLQPKLRKCVPTKID